MSETPYKPPQVWRGMQFLWWKDELTSTDPGIGFCTGINDGGSINGFVVFPLSNEMRTYTAIKHKDNPIIQTSPKSIRGSGMWDYSEQAKDYLRRQTEKGADPQAYRDLEAKIESLRARLDKMGDMVSLGNRSGK